MLDNETKRRIDTARDILVGKVPDPKSQVEQITIALIYKFMDDMDREAVSFGGKPTFFAQPKPTGNESLDNELKDFPKYAWTKIFDPKIGGHEMLSLYSEALLRLNLNSNIPQLFRDIFKNAYLPYRDPETLKLFLKTINEFHYDHSEKLGDAFEYLLSALGSQGEAGQFRTPRHIIDFIVEIVQPKKTESICDPACGTAGFLISSYKHILQANSKKSKGDLLTPDDRKKLMQNFVGYDISPDMVRLSLVNMYLHGFITPHIHEYDTLTSEERWNEYFDVILANPPFMTPKGGIKPHKRFSVKANKSEVLFVDYIIEHLKPTGRAGIIVPEGVIFQNGKAYSSLRKMMIEKNLYAVISLPVGVFNPYTKTTKTSILLFDKSVREKLKSILFVKVENDGFELGAERKPILENDLPKALELIKELKLSDFNNGRTLSSDLIFQLVSLESLEQRHNFNLAVLHDVEEVDDDNYDNIAIGSILKPKKTPIKILPDKTYKQITVKMNGKGAVLRKEIKGSAVKTKSQFLATTGDFIMSKIDARNGAFGIVPSELENAIVTQDFPLFTVDTSVMLPEFLNVVIQSPQFIKICQTTSIGTSNRRRIKIDKFLKSRIPLPNIEEQRLFLEKIKLLNSKIEELEDEAALCREKVNQEIESIWNPYSIKEEEISVVAEDASGDEI